MGPTPAGSSDTGRAVADVERAAPARICWPLETLSARTPRMPMSGTSIPLARAAALAAFTRSTFAFISLAASTRCAWVMRICEFMFLMRAALAISGSTCAWAFADCAMESCGTARNATASAVTPERIALRIICCPLIVFSPRGWSAARIVGKK